MPASQAGEAGPIPVICFLIPGGHIMFETTGKINESLLQEIKRYMLNPKQNNIFLFARVFLGALGVLFLLSKNYLWLFICIVCVVVFTFEAIIIRNKMMKIMLDRMTENTGAPESTYTTSFTDDGIQIKNHETNATAIIKYETIIKFIETNSVFILFTKAWQFTVVFKAELEHKDEFIAFLKSKPTQIKW